VSAWPFSRTLADSFAKRCAAIEEDLVAWFRRRPGSGPSADRAKGDFQHLEHFVQTRRGVEAFLEPKTAVTEVTVMLIAHDGEWTRRRVPSVEAARAWGHRMGVPVYDIALVGYPKRKRDFDERRKRAEQA
jgi:hypothetical protein